MAVRTRTKRVAEGRPGGLPEIPLRALRGLGGVIVRLVSDWEAGNV